MTPALLALVIVGALLAYKLGSVALRTTGGLLFVLGLVNLALSGDGGGVGTGMALGVMVVGVCLWLLGHVWFAYRHRYWRSRLAMRLLDKPLFGARAQTTATPGATSPVLSGSATSGSTSSAASSTMPPPPPPGTPVARGGDRR